MRLKNMDGPLSIHNGNTNSLLNSPKRINTAQNSNIISNYPLTLNNTSYSSAANNRTSARQHLVSDEDTLTLTEHLTVTENTIDSVHDKVQWCNSVQQRRLATNNTNNANNRNNQLNNIKNTLAASLRTTRPNTAISICSESSPDDSVLEYEDAQQSCSSVDVSPQDEDRAFDLSDSESLSDEGNLNTEGFHRRGIVNPNYPGFQHLAHTLDLHSDGEISDDDPDIHNNINNNNNNNGDGTEYQADKFDSVNRLDSVENIQKVFYDKPVFEISCENLNQNLADSDKANSNPSSEEDNENLPQKLEVTLNIKTDETQLTPQVRASLSQQNIIGDFGNEVKRELDRISLDSCTIDDLGNATGGIDGTLINNNDVVLKGEEIEDAYQLPPLEKGIIAELEEVIGKLIELADTEPTAVKYNIEPNTEITFNNQEVKVTKPEVLQDTLTVATMDGKMSDAFLSSIEDNLQTVKDNLMKMNKPLRRNAGEMEVDTNLKKNEAYRRDSNRELEEIECQIKKIKSDTKLSREGAEEVEKFCKEDITKDYKEKEEDSSVPKKKERFEHCLRKRKDYNQQFGSLITFPRKEFSGARRGDALNRRSVPLAKERRKANNDVLDGFDVYNIETAMPKIDLEAIETHLRAAREEERRRRTDREEIRRRLAMGTEDDYYSDRPGRKPSLQARLQSGMNLQICFMNETVSDSESPSSDSDCPLTNPKQPKTSPKNNTNLNQEKTAQQAPARPATLSLGQPLLQPVTQPMTETDFFTRQARLQTEARMALAQAKEMARMQMEIEKQRQKKSPITEMVRNSLEKVGIPFPEEKRRLSRQILTEMNVAQLQVIVNDLHTQIESLNESLVKFLMDRDDLHMEQDSMLVDIEDLTRYLGAKEQVLKDQNLVPQDSATPPSPAPSSPLTTLNNSVKPHLHRIASLVKK